MFRNRTTLSDPLNYVKVNRKPLRVYDIEVASDSELLYWLSMFGYEFWDRFNVNNNALDVPKWVGKSIDRIEYELLGRMR